MENKEVILDENNKIEDITPYVSYTRPIQLKSPQMYGEDVKAVQRRLNELGYNAGTVDGYYGPSGVTAVKAFQGKNSLSVDGSVGPATWNKLFSSSAIPNNGGGSGYKRPLSLKSPQMYGEDVKIVQNKLNYLGYNCGSANGYFGSNTDRAVRKYQKATGISVDGSVGPATWKKLIDGKNLKNVTEQLLGLFIKYEEKYKNLWSGMSQPGQLYTFYNLVRNGGEADLKNQGFNESQYIFDDKVIRGDAPGNILYGYIGKSFKYTDLLLLRAAGFAQQQAGTNKPEWGNWNGNAPYGDDPNDQASIKIGINFYKRVH